MKLARYHGVLWDVENPHWFSSFACFSLFLFGPRKQWCAVTNRDSHWEMTFLRGGAFLPVFFRFTRKSENNRIRWWLPKSGSRWICGIVAPLKTSVCVRKRRLSWPISDLCWKLPRGRAMCVPGCCKGLLVQTLKRSSRAVLVKEKLLTGSAQQEYSELSQCPVVSVFSWGLQSYRLF